MPETSLGLQIKALLFVAAEPLAIARIAELTEAAEEDVRAELTEMRLALAGDGLRLSDLNGAFRLVTAPEASETVRKYLKSEARSELTKPALETLAIIAYRGPIGRAGVDELRGVSSETMLRGLLQRGLIAEHARAAGPGGAVLYTISHEFLMHFGLESASELPPLPEDEV